MAVEVDFGEFGRAVLDLPAEQVRWARSKNRPATQSWEEVVEAALATPIGAPNLRNMDLRGRRVVVITDDWGRPTPAHRVLPAVLREVEQAGARREAITVMTGSGVHAPMNDEEMIRKVGRAVFDSYRCVSHDAVAHEMSYIGLTQRGTPVWINKIAADADVRIAVGRIGPHLTHGYEGGAKMITPAVSHWITVLRNHSTNFSPYAEYGSYELNPSRQDVDDIGGMVGLEFIINFVINRQGEPIAGFAGHRLAAHRAAIAWGDREVWGAEVGQRADIVIAAPGPLTAGASPLELATLACRPGGTTIFINPLGPQLPRDEPFPRGAQPISSNGGPSTGSALQAEMPTWRFDQIFLEHERRDMDLPARMISDRCKTIRGEYYRRRPGITRHVIVVGEAMAPNAEVHLGHHRAPTLQDAVEQALRRAGRAARVVILPEAATSLPLEQFHTFADNDKSIQEWAATDAAAKVPRLTLEQLAGVPTPVVG
jgi:nickel-dependent lactate racemase